MAIQLYDYQQKAIADARSGSIIFGGVGSGKSMVALGYYFQKVCGGTIDNGNIEIGSMTKDVDLYIVTTAKKRDACEWERDALHFMISKEQNPYFKAAFHVVSWNTIQKYAFVSNAFFIFDEQRVCGYGAWSKAFINIAKRNEWLMLSATPGDTWSDYIPVFVANGFYKNKTDFVRQHIVYKPNRTYPVIDHYINVDLLTQHKKAITVVVDYDKSTRSHFLVLLSEYDRAAYKLIARERWSIFDDRPIENSSALGYKLRRVANEDPSKLEQLDTVLAEHARLILFYNFDYERNMVLEHVKDRTVAEWNGHKHEALPDGDQWVYLVQYNAGSEGWECTSTDCLLFFSLPYSFKSVKQASGRIDRMNTPFKDLYYYAIVSSSPMDNAILRALRAKKDFNERDFIEDL